MDKGTKTDQAAADRVKAQPLRIPCPLPDCSSVPTDTPKLKIEADTTEVKEGSSVSMTCKVTSSNPAHKTMSWFKDGLPLQEREQTSMQEQEQTSTLILHEVTKNSSGRYQCKASNDIGQGESEVVLTVLCEFP